MKNKNKKEAKYLSTANVITTLTFLEDTGFFFHFLLDTLFLSTFFLSRFSKNGERWMIRFRFLTSTLDRKYVCLLKRNCSPGRKYNNAIKVPGMQYFRDKNKKTGSSKRIHSLKLITTLPVILQEAQKI